MDERAEQGPSPAKEGRRAITVLAEDDQLEPARCLAGRCVLRATCCSPYSPLKLAVNRRFQRCIAYLLPLAVSYRTVAETSRAGQPGLQKCSAVRRGRSEAQRDLALGKLRHRGGGPAGKDRAR